MRRGACPARDVAHRQDGVGMAADSLKQTTPAVRSSRPPLGPRTLTLLFVLANVILCADPLVPQLFQHGKGKDYPLWYAVGRAVLTGRDLYPKTGQTFAFLYPPFAALLLAPF